MKSPLVVACGIAALAVTAFGGIAAAAEFQAQVDDPIVAEASSPAEEFPAGDDAQQTPDEESEPEVVPGLVCEFDAEALADEELTEDEVVCSGTGNERSAEVATVPRALAHSDEVTGAERGRLISAWAKSEGKNGRGGDAEEPGDDGGEVPEDEAPAAPEAPGRSGDAPGRSGDAPGRSGR